MQCSSLTLFCLRTQWGGESLWALQNLSLGLSVSHPATLMSSAHKGVCSWMLQFPFGGTGCDRGVCVKARATRTRPSASRRQAGGRSLKSEYSEVMAVVAAWWPAMLSKMLSPRGGGCETGTVWKRLQILCYRWKSWSIKWTCQGLISNTTAQLLIVHKHLLQYHNIKTTWRHTRNWNFILKLRAVAGVGAAVLGFSTIYWMFCIQFWQK